MDLGEPEKPWFRGSPSKPHKPQRTASEPENRKNRENRKTGTTRKTGTCTNYNRFANRFEPLRTSCPRKQHNILRMTSPRSNATATATATATITDIIPNPRSQISDPRSQKPDPRSQIPDSRPQIPNLRSGAGRGQPGPTGAYLPLSKKKKIRSKCDRVHEFLL